MATYKLKMVKKGGKMVPSFAADGVGKMKKGGMPKKMQMGGPAGMPMRGAMPPARGPMPQGMPPASALLGAPWSMGSARRAVLATLLPAAPALVSSAPVARLLPQQAARPAFPSTAAALGSTTLQACARPAQLAVQGGGAAPPPARSAALASTLPAAPPPAAAAPLGRPLQQAAPPAQPAAPAAAPPQWLWQ
jgi:hypothetical protein